MYSTAFKYVLAVTEPVAEVIPFGEKNSEVGTISRNLGIYIATDHRSLVEALLFRSRCVCD